MAALASSACALRRLLTSSASNVKGFSTPCSMRDGFPSFPAVFDMPFLLAMVQLVEINSTSHTAGASTYHDLAPKIIR